MINYWSLHRAGQEAKKTIEDPVPRVTSELVASRMVG